MAFKHIRILGDFAPLGNASQRFSDGSCNWFLGELWGADEPTFNVVNLECPLVEHFDPILKNGPAIGLKSLHVDALRGFSLVSLANNHIMDHGVSGLTHTLHLLDAASISHLGAGHNLEEASKPHIAEIDGVTVGFLAWSHHEFCIATSTDAGAFPIDLTIGLEVLEQLSSRCDFVVLLYHGGVEHFPYPTPEQRKNCHFLAKRGVDLIVCQHSHIVGASEVVGNSTILYGQGNYCLDLKGKEGFEHWSQGLLLDVSLEMGKPLRVKYVPIVQDVNDGMRPKLASPDVATEILNKQKKLSETLLNADDYQQVWAGYVEQQANNFLYGQLPVGRYIRKALKILGWMRFPWGRHQALKVLNCMECEAHSDVIVAGLKEILNKEKRS